MEVQLQELIEKIKSEGVEAAEAEGAAIVDAAKAKAEKIVASARAQADQILKEAKEETERMTESGEEALRQAGRNLLLSFRESVSRELKNVIGEKVSCVYSSEALAKMIVTVVENWAKVPDAEGMEVILNSEDLKKLEETLFAALKERMLEGVTLKADDRFDCGFRVASNGTGAYYDYSAEAVADMLSNYLSPRLTELLKEA